MVIAVLPNVVKILGRCIQSTRHRANVAIFTRPIGQLRTPPAHPQSLAEHPTTWVRLGIQAHIRKTAATGWMTRACLLAPSLTDHLGHAQ